MTCRKQFITFLRHGQAKHNPRAEVARRNGCSFDEFLQLMREDDAFDAPLTKVGIEQAKNLSESNNIITGKRDMLPEVDLVVSSPLSRAIDTAMLVFPRECKTVPFVCIESIRERNGLLLSSSGQAHSARKLGYKKSEVRNLEQDFIQLNYYSTIRGRG